MNIIKNLILGHLVLGFFVFVLSYSPAKADDKNPISFSDNSENNEDVFASLEAIDGEELDENRGAFIENGAIGLASIEQVAANNTVINSKSGNNQISEAAFDSASGVVSVIQNSGNNNNISTATVVSVQIESAPIAGIQ